MPLHAKRLDARRFYPAAVLRDEDVTPRPSLWRHGDFLKLWSGQTVSLLGSSVTNIALPLVALGVLQATVFQMGVLSALAYVPYVAFGLFAGVWVDRLPRRSVLIAANLARALFLIVIPVGAVAGVLRIEVLYAVALAFGIATVFFEFAYQAYLPTLVPAETLVDGNSKLAQSQSVARIVGPSLAGVLIELVTAPLAIIVDAVSYLVSAASLLLIRQREPAQAAARRRPVLHEVREGLSFVFRHPVIRVLAINSGLSNFSGSIVSAVYFVYLARELALSPALIGIVLAAGGPGALLASATAGPVAERMGVGPAMLAGQLFMVGTNALLASAVLVPAAAFPLLLLASFVLGAGATYYNVTLFSMRQALTPAELRGRTVASVRLVTVGTMPVGALVGGFLGETIGISATILIAFAVAVVALLPVLLSEVPRLRTVPSAS